MNYRIFKIKQKIVDILYNSIMYITRPIRIYTTTDGYKKMSQHRSNIKSIKNCIERIYKAFSLDGYEEFYITSYRDFEDDLMIRGWDGFYFLEEEKYMRMFIKKLDPRKFTISIMDLDEYKKSFVKAY